MSQKTIAECSKWGIIVKKFSGAVSRNPEYGEVDTLCWAARLMSLTIGLSVALWAIGALVLIIRDDSDYSYVLYVLIALVGFIPLLFAAFSWRQHLVGGISMIAFVAGFLPYALLATGSDWHLLDIIYLPLFVASAVFLAGGLLHLMVWWREEKKKPVPRET